MRRTDGDPHGGRGWAGFRDVAGPERVGRVTPGEGLREEFMVPLGLWARELGVPSNRITAILAGTRGVTAVLLGERFGTSAEFWLNLQIMHDLEEGTGRLEGPPATSPDGGFVSKPAEPRGAPAPFS